MSSYLPAHTLSESDKALPVNELPLFLGGIEQGRALRSSLDEPRENRWPQVSAIPSQGVIVFAPIIRNRRHRWQSGVMCGLLRRSAVPAPWQCGEPECLSALWTRTPYQIDPPVGHLTPAHQPERPGPPAESP